MPWYNYIDRKRRPNFLAILEELSRWQAAPTGTKHDPDFLLVGAVSLLMQGYLRYLAWWDIDLLFRDQDALQRFAQNVAAPGLRIVRMDDEIISTEDITCLHTVWSFGRTWANVDYIYRPQRFQFFYETVRGRVPFSQTIEAGERAHQINLWLGDPWDIFVDKLTLRRTVEQLHRKDIFGIDLRHIVIILQRDHANQNFWKHIVTKSETLQRKDLLRDVLLRLIEIGPELGYQEVCDPKEVAIYFGERERPN